MIQSASAEPSFINMEQLLAALSGSAHAGNAGVQQLLAQLNTAARAGTSSSGTDALTLDACVCSFGGVGSSELTVFLNRQGFSTNLMTDADGLRHIPHPPAWPATSVPKVVIYLYGDPYGAIASHYRRGHAHHQALKTSGSPACVGPEHAFPASFEEYCARGEDIFGLQAHFESWLQGSPTYPILALRYEDMFEPHVAFELFQRLCAAKGFQVDQAEYLAAVWCSCKRERASFVPLGCLQTGMYAALQERMQSLPPLLLVPPRQL